MARIRSRSRACWALNVVEACYRVGSGLGEWLQGVVDASLPALESGYGVGGHVFERRGEDVRSLALEYGGKQPPERLASLFYGGAAHLNQEELKAAYSQRPKAIMRMSDAFTEWFGRDLLRSSPSFSAFAEAGVHDVVCAYGVTPDGLGYALAAPLARAEEGEWNPELSRWSRLRAHVLAGIRLHASPRKEDAVLTPTGKVVHAEHEARDASARDALHEAAKRIDHARSRRGRNDPDAALEVWQGLVSGRWSLVDQFDSDGRRYVIARRNDPVLESPRSLTRAERQVLAYATLGRSNKEIAYELGLSVSTVSSHLNNATKRLKVGSRTAFAMCSALRDDVVRASSEDA